MKFIATLALIFTSIGLTSCATTTDTQPPSAIAGCGGGIERSITTKIEANYTATIKSGKLDADFADTIKPIFDANAAAKEKYDSYLACFKEIDARVRKDLKRTQCNNVCDLDQQQCLRDQKGVYDQCLRKGQASCMIDCYAQQKSMH